MLQTCPGIYWQLFAQVFKKQNTQKCWSEIDSASIRKPLWGFDKVPSGKYQAICNFLFFLSNEGAFNKTLHHPSLSSSFSQSNFQITVERDRSLDFDEINCSEAADDKGLWLLWKKMEKILCVTSLNEYFHQVYVPLPEVGYFFINIKKCKLFPDRSHIANVFFKL